jgi:hypothetical protein
LLLHPIVTIGFLFIKTRLDGQTHQGGANMSGRWTTWFLEDGLSREMYRKHKREVEASMQTNTYRDLIRVYVDFRLWPDGRRHQTLFEQVSDDRAGVHYGELTGKTGYLFQVKQTYFLKVIESDSATVLDIPIHAMVSYSSSGFPKVAYRVEQYLEGYLTWLTYFQAVIDHRDTPQQHRDKLAVLQPQLLPENFSQKVFPLVREGVKFVHAYLDQPHNEDAIEKLKAILQSLTDVMIVSMKEDVVARCKPPYLHLIEWHTNQALLTNDHRLVKAYLHIRKVVPAIVMGFAFIPVSKI